MVKSFTNIFFTTLFMLYITLASGQKDVYFQINQYIDNKTFTIGSEGINDLGNKFNLSRLDYYISSIKLHHDGGVTTDVTNKYIFVSKGDVVNELLGTFNITLLDSITFSIGVEETDNHADPTLWPADHPLAPKSPEMHWGWAAGYRFIAAEGKCGSSLQFDYELHSIGDELYKSTTVVTKGSDENGVLKIKIDANYEQGFKGINMNKNVFVHGGTKEAKSIVINYNRNVFRPSEGTSGVNNYAIGTLNIYPNPSMDGKVTVGLTEDQIIDSKIIVRDALGRVCYQILNPMLKNEVLVDQVGFYTIELIQGDRISYRSNIVKQ
jgi:hypothetical protein